MSNKESYITNFIFSLSHNSLVLDAGCEYGKNMVLRNDVSIVGIDSNPNCVKICQDRDLCVVVGNIDKINFPDKTFDAAICVNTINKLYNPIDRLHAIKELFRVVEDNGYIFIKCLSIHSFYNIKNQMRYIRLLNTENDFIISKNFQNEWKVYHLFDKYEFINLLRTVDCEILDILFEDDYIIGVVKKLK